jgi:hypothetical protein
MNDDQLISQHKEEKARSIDFKSRRFTQWNENYYLLRDKVLTNRLTQRQSVNIPVARETLQTWISKIDEAPMLTFESRGRSNQDKSGEIVLNELWNYYYESLKLDILDNMEKKIVGTQGRGFKKLGWSNNKFFCDLIDPYDIDIDPKANALDLDGTADYVIHTHIFKPLRKILANKDYSAEGKAQLKTYLDTTKGVLAVAQNEEDAIMRRQRLETLGVTNFDDYKASDLIVELNESYKLIWDDKEKQFVRHLIVIALDSIILYNKPLKEAMGINRLPIITWASDPDLNDIWSDGIVDNVRTINKVINMYFSQDLENRTYRNFGMYFFNTLNGTFQPRTFDPKPFGMYGVPGNPAEIVQQMRIEPLADTNNTIEYLKNLIQSSVAVTPTEQGVQEKGSATLGEIQLNLQASTQRNAVVAKNYRKAWEEAGQVFYELLNSNSRGAITLYKKGSDGNYYSKDVMPSDWQNPLGYECKVVLKQEKSAEDDMDLKKLQYIKNSFQNNPIAQKIARQKELELLEWTLDEIKEVMAAEGQAPQVGPDGQPMAPQTPNQPIM